jgi:Flp pilus assembly CpaE family ATPase
MNSQIRVLLVEDNEGDVRLMKDLVAAAEGARMELSHVCRLGDALSQLAQETFDVIVLDLSLPDSKGLNTVVLTHQAVQNVPILVLSGQDDQDLAIRALQCGAQDYLVKGQSHGTQLLRAIRYAVARQDRQAAHSPSPSATQTDRVFGLFGAKGGCGATTVACHLARELNLETGQRVLLADLDLVSGAVGFVMRTKSPYTVLDVAENIHRLDPELWKGMVSYSYSASNLQILTAPTALSDKGLPKSDRISHVLRFVRRLYDWTVVDLGRGVTEYSLPLLNDIDQNFIVTTPDPLALAQTEHTIKALVERGYPKDHLHLVVNRMPKWPKATPKEIEGVLRLPIYAVLPDSPGPLDDAHYKVKPALTPRNSSLGAEFTHFARKVAARGEPVAKSRKLFIFGWRRNAVTPECARPEECEARMDRKARSLAFGPENQLRYTSPQADPAALPGLEREACAPQ